MDSTPAWTVQFATAARDFDWAALARVADGYVNYLRTAETRERSVRARAVLSLLRENRRYEELLRVSDALLGNGADDAAIKRQFAQALVDRDSPAAALLVFQTLLADPALSESEHAEARGGEGRCYKQLFVASHGSGRAAAYLEQALSSYRLAYKQDRGLIWHGINVVALLARAAREAIAVPGEPDPRAASGVLARELIERIDNDPDPDAWAIATRAEAYLALDDFDAAREETARFTADRDADPFKIAAVLRQFREIWQLTNAPGPAQDILPVLRAALLRQDGGSVSVDAIDIAAARQPAIGAPVAGQDLELVLGDTRFRALTWYRRGLERCSAVVQIESLAGDPIGTGFVVDGRTLHEDLPARVVVTNGHVLPEGLPPSQAEVVFSGLADPVDGSARHRVVRQWWYAPSTVPGLDTTLIEIDSCPDQVAPIPIASALPALTATDPPRAYVIGHPNGLAQPQFSLNDNVLLDYDEHVAHYRSPTEPGSSGSPVFDNSWRLIALHHSGSTATPRLHNQGGLYAANEGIRISAIIAALRECPPRGIAVGG